LLSLQAGRGLAALSVVLFHTSAVFALPKYWGSHPFGLLFQPGSAGVYYFFVLSGFIIAYAHAKDIGDPGRLLRYLANRTKRIYPMYWIVTAVTLGYLYFAHMLSAEFFQRAYFVGDVTLLPFDGDHGTLAVAWTLFHEIVFYFAFCTLIISLRAGIIALAVWAVGCASNIFLLHGLPPDTAGAFAGVVFAPINLLFFFGIGVYVAFENKHVRLPTFLLCAGIAVFIGTWTYEMIWPQREGTLIPILLFGIGAALIVLTLCDFEKRSIVKIPHALVVLGDASYSIYLTHFLVIAAIAKVLSLYRSSFFQYFAFFVMVSISVCDRALRQR
jgi:exopolysaccharide production protein ExoZ